MRGLKTILIFVFSAVYTSCIWLLFILPVGSDYKIIPTLFVVFSTMLILIFGGFWLSEHWGDD